MYQQNQTTHDDNALQTDRFSQVQFYVDQARRGRADYLSQKLRRLRAGLNRQLNLIIPTRPWTGQGGPGLGRGRTDNVPA